MAYGGPTVAKLLKPGRHVMQITTTLILIRCKVCRRLIPPPFLSQYIPLRLKIPK